MSSIDCTSGLRFWPKAFCDGDRLYQINRQRSQELSESDSLFCLIQDGVLVPLWKETDE